MMETQSVSSEASMTTHAEEITPQNAYEQLKILLMSQPRPHTPLFNPDLRPSSSAATAAFAATLRARSRSPRPSGCTQCPGKVGSHDPPAPFRFMDLPAEIQNQIVDIVLVDSEPIVIHEPRFNRHPSRPPLRRAPGSRPRFDRPVPVPAQPPPWQQMLTPPMSRTGSSDGEPQKQDAQHKDGEPERRSRSRVAKRGSMEDGHTRLALLMTCRSLYTAHWRSYYARNRFVFNLETLQAFVRSIPPPCLFSIKHVQMKMPHFANNKRMWQLLGQFEGLEVLTLWLKGPHRFLNRHDPCDREDYVTYLEGLEVARRVRSLRRLELRRVPPDECYACAHGGAAAADEHDNDNDDDHDIDENIMHNNLVSLAVPITTPTANTTTLDGNGNTIEVQTENPTQHRMRVLAEDKQIQARVNAYLAKRHVRRREKEEKEKKQCKGKEEEEEEEGEKRRRRIAEEVEKELDLEV